MTDIAPKPLPLADVRVVEFTHMIMGPSCGMLLADLGAEVIKVEPLKGDNTRRMPGSGAGFFAVFNRNKQSLAVNMDDARGRRVSAELRGINRPDQQGRCPKPATPLSTEHPSTPPGCI